MDNPKPGVKGKNAGSTHDEDFMNQFLVSKTPDTLEVCTDMGHSIG